MKHSWCLTNNPSTAFVVSAISDCFEHRHSGLRHRFPFSRAEAIFEVSPAFAMHLGHRARSFATIPSGPAITETAIAGWTPNFDSIIRPKQQHDIPPNTWPMATATSSRYLKGVENMVVELFTWFEGVTGFSLTYPLDAEGVANLHGVSNIFLIQPRVKLLRVSL